MLFLTRGLNTAAGNVIGKVSAQYRAWPSQVRAVVRRTRSALPRARRTFCSLDALKTSVEDRISTWNDTTRVFKWTKGAQADQDRSSGPRPLKWTKAAGRIIDRLCR